MASLPQAAEPEHLGSFEGLNEELAGGIAVRNIWSVPIHCKVGGVYVVVLDGDLVEPFLWKNSCAPLLCDPNTLDLPAPSVS